jgi:hypothetical protein
MQVETMIDPIRLTIRGQGAETDAPTVEDLLARIEADAVQFMRPKEELPRPGDIVDDNFTGGLKSEEYLARLRSGGLS